MIANSKCIPSLLSMTIIGGLSLGPFAPAHAQVPGPTPQQILKQTIKVYRNCATYTDSGEYSNGTGKAVFTTQFVRPSSFRFDYKFQDLLQSYGYKIEQTPKLVTFSRSFFPLPTATEPMDSLGMAIASAAGVTSEVAHRIPVLLLPREVGGTSLNDMTNLRRLPDAMVGKSKCYRLRGEFFGDVTLWIDHRTSLIVKVTDGNEVTTYNPQINQRVAIATLRKLGNPKQ